MINNKKGNINLLELIILIVLGIELILILCNGFGWLGNKVNKGSDAFTLNTCESVTKVNSSNGFDCPVNDCAKGELCTHKVGEYYIGYFDDVKNTIVGYKISGYNYEDNPVINGKVFKGLKGTMIIKVTCGNGDIKYEWVNGK